MRKAGPPSKRETLYCEPAMPVSAMVAAVHTMKLSFL